MRPGSTRIAIEEQLGKPKLVTNLPDGDMQVIYRTARMSKTAKANLINGHIEGDILSLGLFELIGPAFVAEDEAQFFKIEYSPTGIAKMIISRCENSRSQRWSAFTSATACARGAAPL